MRLLNLLMATVSIKASGGMCHVMNFKASDIQPGMQFSVKSWRPSNVSYCY
jgi:hypothetical protein